MGKYTRVFYAIVLAVYANHFYEMSCTATSIPDTKHENINDDDMHLIGTVDGKSFFADMTKRNWTDSKKTCQGVGMRLASITTLAQRATILSAFDSVTFKWWFWTGGRGTQKPSQLSWDEAGGAPNDTLIQPLLRYNETCLAVLVQSNQSIMFDLETCGFSCGVICEIYHGIPW